MKNLILFFIAFGLLSCHDYEAMKKEKNPQRFSTQMDTVYKKNSTEIETVTRTFYKKGKAYDDYVLEVTQVLGKKEYKLEIVNWKDKSATAVGEFTLKNDKAFVGMLDILDTLLIHKGKKLTYDIQKDVSLNSFDVGNIALFIYNRSYSASFWFSSREIDSLKSCYYRYIDEKQ